MDWVRTVQLAELLLKTIQANKASQSKAGEKKAMNDQTPTTDAGAAATIPDTQPVATAPTDAVPTARAATTSTDATTADGSTDPTSAPPAASAPDAPAAIQDIDTATGHDTLAVMQSAIKLAQFLSENKDVMAFMNTLMGIKPPERPGVS